MERLGRLAYRIVWVSPHGVPGMPHGVSSPHGVSGMPVGMMAAAPHVDLLLSGHDLASLEELAAALPSLR
jgi:hypothetical protein